MALDDIYNTQFFIDADDKAACVNLAFYEKVPRVGTVAEVTKQLGDQLDIDFWTTFWQVTCSAAYSYLRTIAQKIFPTRDAPYITEASNGEAGSAIGDPMNGTTAVLVSEYGATWSANFRGRMYLTGLRESKATLGRIDAVELAIIQSLFDSTFIGDLVLPAPADVTLHTCVFSPSRAHPPGDPPPPPILPVYSELVTAIVRPRIATQRRRRTPVAAPA